MIKVINRSGANELGLKGVLWEFTCSEVADLANLPTSKSEGYPYDILGVRAGSTCICTEDCSEHMLGADDEWYNLTKGGKSVIKAPNVTLYFETYNDWVNEELGSDSAPIYAVSPFNQIEYLTNEYKTIKTDTLAVYRQGSGETTFEPASAVEKIGNETIDGYDMEVYKINEDCTVNIYISY